MAKAKEVIKYIVGDQTSGTIKYRRSLESYARDYLKIKGWDKSVYGNRSVNNDGPTPWITYPAMRVLERIIRPEWKVFEYGCGQSSLWWSERVASIVSVEDDPSWAAQISARGVSNLRVILREVNDAVAPELTHFENAFYEREPYLPTSHDEHADAEAGLLCRPYAAYALELAQFGKDHFDLVVVDGMARSLSAFMAAEFVKDGGIILFDNSDRWQYEAGFDALEDAGYKRIDFYGTGPVNTFEWCTSIFCRDLSFLPSSNRLPRLASDLGW